jgi:hypothetical protein
MKLSASNPLDSLVDLACRDGVDIRPTLLRVLTDLYVQKPTHSLEEETQFVELALGLIHAADAATLAAVTIRLGAYPSAPAAVLGKLAKASSPGIASARPARDDLIELFFSASPEERRLILINLDIASDARRGRPLPVAGELARRLENAALRRDQGEFVRILERALEVSRELAQKITEDHSGEPVVVAAKALGMKAEVLQRILLFLNPAIGQSAQRVYELSHLFDEITSAGAERMVNIWRTTGSRKPLHAPVYWNDERTKARHIPKVGASRPAEHAGRPALPKTGEG